MKRGVCNELGNVAVLGCHYQRFEWCRAVLQVPNDGWTGLDQGIKCRWNNGWHRMSSRDTHIDNCTPSVLLKTVKTGKTN
jgi:hypothetical protein